jgi:hypothetical protein
MMDDEFVKCVRDTVEIYSKVIFLDLSGVAEENNGNYSEIKVSSGIYNCLNATPNLLILLEKF